MRPTAILAAALLLAGAAFADKLEYVDRDAATGAALVEHGQGKQAVREGDEIPGWGRVKSVDERELRLERRLTDAEREALRKKGALPVATEEIIVPRRDLRTVPVPAK